MTGSSLLHDIITTLKEVGDFESAIVTEDMLEYNQKDYQTVVELFGEDKITTMHYIPEYYEMRDRCRAVAQTGDYGIHALAIIVAGYQSADIPLETLKKGLKYDRKRKDE